MDRIDTIGGVRAIGQSASGAGQAALFKATSGTLAGHVFAVIDTNGVAVDQAGQDVVIELVNAVLPIDPTVGVIV